MRFCINFFCYYPCYMFYQVNYFFFLIKNHALWNRQLCQFEKHRYSWDCFNHRTKHAPTLQRSNASRTVIQREKFCMLEILSFFQDRSFRLNVFCQLTVRTRSNLTGTLTMKSFRYSNKSRGVTISLWTGGQGRATPIHTKT